MTLYCPENIAQRNHGESLSILYRHDIELINEIRLRQNQKLPTFLLPTKFISQEAALVGHALSTRYNQLRTKPTDHKTFFCCSRYEAFCGAVKILRHNSLRMKRSSEILFYEPNREFTSFINPLNAQKGQELIPGVTIVASLSDLTASLETKSENFGSLIFSHNGKEAIEDIDRLFSLCKRRNMFTCLDESRRENWYTSPINHLFSTPPDVIILGENLAKNTMPFGCFTMTNEMYKPWNTFTNCLLHSSTYSGNLLALNVVLSQMHRHEMVINRSDFSKKQIFNLYRKYINPNTATVFEIKNLCPIVERATGSILYEAGGSKPILDCVGGSGCSFRGHNPRDILKVLDTHDPTKNYFSSFASLLSELTNLPHIFPSVSGSTSVDIALSLGLVASKPRTKILSFSENYSGKSLISINTTRFSAYRKPFTPLYFDVVEYNPFDESQIKQLEQELLSGTVAVVFFELLQGNTLRHIPERIIEVVNKHKEKGGYFVGVDEILTGSFRTGTFLFAQNTPLQFDIICLAKGLSDMTIPIGAVAISRAVYEAATKQNPEFVNFAQEYFKNQLGAHISSHALEAFSKEVGQANVFQASQIIKSANIENTIIEEIRGKGLLLYFKYHEKMFPMSLFGEELSEFLMSYYFLEKSRIFILSSRLTPSLLITHEEAKRIRNCIETKLIKKNRWQLGFYFASILIKVKLLKLYKKISMRIS